MDRRKRKALEWYLKFIYTDLDKVTEQERNILSADVAAKNHRQTRGDVHSEPGSIRQGIADIIGPGLSTKRNLKSAQKRLKDFFECLVDQIEKAMKRREADWLPVDQAFFPSSTSSFRTYKAVIGLQAVGIAHDKKPISSHQFEVLYRPRSKSIENATLTMTFDSARYGDILLYQLVHILEGAPLKAFRRCPQCDHFFLHFTNKKRIFCRNLCAVRYGEKKRREKKRLDNPEDYEQILRANAARARKSYTKKVKGKTPDAEPKRRPYKYK